MASSGSGQGGDSFVSVTIDPDPGFALEFHSLTGSEELGRPFQIDLALSSGTAKPDLTSLLGCKATLAITLPDRSKRYFNGIIARASYLGLSEAGYSYHLELRPWIWLLSRTQDCRIFQNKTVWQIITSVFSDAGFSDVSDKRQNATGSQTLEYCVQYNETTLDFVTRLMEAYGLYYYVTHADGQHTLVIADDPNCHPPLDSALPYLFRETELRTVDEHVWDWQSELCLQPGTATFRDYNFTTPAADLTGKSSQAASHPHGGMEVYEYPGAYDSGEDGTRIADLRVQAFGANRQRLSGTTNARKLVAGCRFTLSGFSDSGQNQEYLVTATQYSLGGLAGMQQTGGDLADTYTCKFTAIPASLTFRLPCATRWPVMRGPQTAKVVGASGDEITTDQYGRIKVQFFWDRTGTNDQNSSCWIRVAQTWTGAGWGSIFIPRVGQEVVVDFLDGNPDRPIATGCVYNAANAVPYALDANKTRSTLKTNSSSGGGGFNELRFEDKAGSEEVFFQAQKDYNKVVLNSETAKITQDSTITVDQGNRSVTLNQGNHSLTVSQGNHSITVTAGSSTISAGQSITLKVGSNSLTIDASGVAINGTRIALTASAEMTADGGAEMTLQAGMVNIN